MEKLEINEAGAAGGGIVDDVAEAAVAVRKRLAGAGQEEAVGTRERAGGGAGDGTGEPAFAGQDFQAFSREPLQRHGARRCGFRHAGAVQQAEARDLCRLPVGG